MSFQFRFASILQLRGRERDAAGASVGQAGEAIRRVEEQIEAIQRERQSLRSGADDMRVGTVSVDALLAGGRYDIQLEADIESLARTHAELIQELERRQLLLKDAEAEVKRFERLEEKDRHEFNAEQLRREQVEADEATSRRYTIERQR